MSRPLLFSALAGALALLSACATTQPSADQIADACDLLTDNHDWYKALRHSSKEWGAPMGLQLAIVNQESSFDGHARPARGPRKFFGLVQGDRPSTAYGYAQALETTWEQYKKSTGNRGADRHSFRDSVDFIGWYVNNTGLQAGVGQYDYKAHYLAYHEGAGGYVQGTWRRKTWLVQRANHVAGQAARYESQIKHCKALRPKFLGIF
ncbi:MAG: hypothetical protein GC155_14555 [Alphaproteobacteria bacterium]|nr:hypothetical protein [Alphaproteobacteria bacterium]